MLLSEFETLTGIHPSQDLWAAINQAYSESTLDKHIWCAKYKTNENGMAERIARNADKAALNAVNERLADLEQVQNRAESLERELSEARRQLDRELEWHPARDIGTNLSAEEYALLAGDGEQLGDLEAIRRVYEECGFDMAKIRIVETVCSYESNKHRICRISGEYTRRPVWASTDWNYIRFNVGGNQWELVNGDLLPYYD
ncbi:MAG: hypothetical protein J6S92_13150 [Oscillospiraceae bacterium]|nr:hypothetical protein [Oscillospiraceae bacterium]MBP0989206.1 hypothetical protein [Oscillospiraceae bacterium]